MSIKIESGKYYKDRNGVIHGPLDTVDDLDYPFIDHSSSRMWAESGKYLPHQRSSFDLIEEVNYPTQSESCIRKPPIGLTPINIFLELQNKQRVQEILDACSRYNEANMNIPQEWIDELSSRRGEIKIENVVPNYMKDFEHDGGTYSVVEDTTRDGCDECHFHRRSGCGSINDTFASITSFKCFSAPIRIHFVKKEQR